MECATFAGHFCFAQGKSLPPVLLPPFCLLGWHASLQAGLEPPNPWVPTADGKGVEVSDEFGPHQLSDKFLALNWIQYVAQHVLPKFGLLLQGEVWYQGCAAMDTGRFYADTHGSIVRQTIKLCPGMAGAVACNNLVLLQALPLQEIMATDGFGRTAAMLAALYNSWEVLHHMLQLPEGINWSQTQSKQAGYTGRTALHYLCDNAPTAASVHQHAEIVNLLPDTLPPRILNSPDEQSVTPLVLAIKSRNMALLQWLLSHGADPDGGGLATSAPKPITAALQLKDARYLGQLLANGAASNVCAVPGKSLLSSALELRHADHLELLVQYGADLDAVHENDSTHRTHGVSDSHDQTIRQTISDFPAGSSRVALKTAMAKGLAARRHLVVLTLGARAVPALSRDVLQLICQHASLMP